MADQNNLGSSISALGTGLSVLLRNKNDDQHRAKALKYFLDAQKLLSESYFHLSKTSWKGFSYPILDRKAKALLEREKTNSFLFGKKLSTRLKTEKSIEKFELTLKIEQIVTKTPSKPSTHHSATDIYHRQFRVMFIVLRAKFQLMTTCTRRRIHTRERWVAGRLKKLLSV